MRIRKGIAILVAAVSGLAPVAPARATTGEPVTGPCSVVEGVSVHDGREAVLALHATAPGAIRVVATCQLIQYGVVVAEAHAYGMVAVDAATSWIDESPYFVCFDQYAAFADGTEVRDQGCSD